MATPTPMTSLPTRQQLDEIDALLRRMLSLPGLPGEPAEAPPPPEPPAPAITYPAPAVREVPAPREPLAGEPVVREWRASWPAASAGPSPSVAAWGSPVPPPAAIAPTFAPSVPPGDPPFAAPVAPLPAAVTPPPLASPATPPAAAPVQLLVLLNGLVTLLTYLLGPLGAWVRGPGRGVLGWCGILMIVVSAAWAAGEWIGYDWSSIDLSRYGLPKFGR